LIRSSALLTTILALGVLSSPAALQAQTSASAPPPSPTAPPPAVPAAPLGYTGTGANLNIAPKRLVLDRSRRSGTIYIYNQGDAVGIFDILLVDRVMLPDGSIVPVTDAAIKPGVQASVDQLKSSRDFLQVSPRRVTLAPRQGQTVRLRLSPSAPTGGEYRTHLTITSIPPREAGTTAESVAAAATGQFRFQISTLFGLSIPIVARLGDIDVRASIENVHVEEVPAAPGALSPRPTAVLTFDLIRQGASSLYGNVEVRVAGRRGDLIGLAKGVGVYPEIARRSVRLALIRPPAPGEKLEITFTDDDTSPGKVLARIAP
jgi:hypothetical protein